MLTVLTDSSFYKKMLLLMVPSMLQQLLTIGINMCDTIMVGSFGEAQIAAVALANMFVLIFTFVLMGLGSGAIVMSSQFWGRRDIPSVRYVVSVALRVCLIISAIFAMLMLAFPEVIMRCYTNQEPIIEKGAEYFRILSWSILFQGFSATATYLLRSTGHVRVPLISSILAFFVNIFFNWMFIFGKLGAPRMEIAGAAVGTVIARCLEFTIIMSFLMLQEKNIGFRFRHLLMRNAGLFRDYIRYSLPVLFSDTLLGIGLSVTSAVLGHISGEMVAAVAIVQSLAQVTKVYSTALANASGVIIGITIGENGKERAFAEGKAFILISIILGLVGSLIVLLLYQPFLSLYDVEESTKQIAIPIFKLIIIMIPLQSLAFTTSKGILRGSGDTGFIMIADIVLLWAVSIPLGALAGLAWHWAPVWVYLCLHLEYPAKGLLCTARFLSGKSIREIGVKSESRLLPSQETEALSDRQN